MSKPFKFGVKPTKKSKVYKPYQPIKLAQPEQEMGLINGIKPDSKEEWWFAQGLRKINKDFDYQVSLNGGRSREGGQILDFLVHTVPLWTPIFIQGKYWHSGQYGSTDAYKLARCSTLLKQLGINSTEPIEVWTQFMGNADETLQMVRRLFA